jgi:hypothetical protein
MAEDYTGDQWTPDKLRGELLVQRRDAGHYRDQLERLGAWLLTNMPHEIRGDPGFDTSAVGTAIRLLDGYRLDGQKLATGLLELCPDEGEPVPEGHPHAGESTVDAVLRRFAEAVHDAARFHADHQGACQTIAQMHAAAVGEAGCAPRRGVVEDVADVRTRMVNAEHALAENLRAAAEAELGTDLPGRPAEIVDQLARQHARMARYLSAAGLDINPVDAAKLPSPHLVADMLRISSTCPAVEYDAHDRPDERAAVIAAAVLANLVPVPSETVTPRSYRGAALPTDGAALDLAAEAAAYRWPTSHPPIVAGAGVVNVFDLALRALVDQARPVLQAVWRSALEAAANDPVAAAALVDGHRPPAATGRPA